MAFVQDLGFFKTAQHLLYLSATLLLVGTTSYVIGLAVYNLFLHPLHSYPGPTVWRMSSLPLSWHMWNGTLMRKIERFHSQYGETIRIAPDELSYTNAQAWKDIFAHIPGKEEWPKHPRRTQKTPNGIPNILGAEKEPHARYRRLLAHAFSEKGLREQEGLIGGYVNLLIERLSELAKAGKVTTIVDWYNMTVFDVIGDLSWGASFDCLQTGRVHEWIPAIQGALKFVFQSSVPRALGLASLVPYLVPKDVQASRAKNYKFASERVKARIDHGQARGDFWDHVLIKSANDNESGDGMSEGEMLNNASVLVLGGSETSATTLSGATFLLLTHPDVMKKLVHETRTSFQSADEITLFSVNKLTYMLAVIEESMRLYPPVVFTGWRTPPKGGGRVMGKFIPEGVRIEA